MRTLQSLLNLNLNFNFNLPIDTVLPLIESTTPNIKRFSQCIRRTSLL